MDIFSKQEEGKLWRKMPWALGDRKGLGVGVGTWDSTAGHTLPRCPVETLTSLLH